MTPIPQPPPRPGRLSRRTLLRAALLTAPLPAVAAATAAAGVQVMSADEVAGAARLLVAADVNAVPPEGIAGVGVMDKGKPIAGTQAVGIGALAVGNVKYQVENGLLVAMRQADKPLYLGFREAFAKARELLADKS